ncbi:MAG: decarboxylating 6-phosphogluconate dehydrogenase [Propionivibrio sp.]|nr:decarboxylating 6-phosphogluconate dehydrogenase [Propionivibrio sp.]
MTMRLAMIGLGKMGANMVRRLCRQGIEVVGFDRDAATVARLGTEAAMITAASVSDAVSQLTAPRIVWLMLPSGDPTETQLKELAAMLSPGDVVIDGGNSNYKDSQRRGAWLAERGIEFMDAGTSGGVWGLDNGYCLMVGGSKEVAAIMKPVLQALAPAPDRGWAHVGPVGAGHYSKMLHNGIEYGMMQALAEGLDLLKNKKEFDFDLAQLTELWRHGSVVRSWLLDLTADALKDDQELASIAPHVSDSGEGRWTVIDSVEQGIAAPVLTLALQMRFASQDDTGYANRLLSMMRNAFGGHAIKGSK